MLPFEMQPIVQISNSRVVTFELLRRGARPTDWAAVDASVVSF